jgi:hypothetical protein
VQLQLPGFDAAHDEMTDRPAGSATAEVCARDLLDLPRGSARMLLLRGVREGRVTIGFSSGLELRVEWPAAVMPTLGIWWNNRGYPDEEGCRRSECAFESIPGSSSSLAHSWRREPCLSVEPAGRRSWEIDWHARV